MHDDQSSPATGAALPPNGKTPETELIRALESLDILTDAVTGEVLPDTSRERAILELELLMAYGAPPGYFPALRELRLALVGAQRGNKHPMLMPAARKVDPHHDDGRAKSGAPSRGMRELMNISIAAVLVNHLAFHGHTKTAAAQTVAARLNAAGIQIPKTKIARCAREEIADGKHRRAACNGEALDAGTTAWVTHPDSSTKWMIKPAAIGAAEQAPPAPSAVLQNHYDRLWPRLEQRYRDLRAHGIDDRRDAAIAAMKDLLASHDWIDRGDQARVMIEAAMPVLKSQ